jgi:hypothetical protein
VIVAMLTTAVGVFVAMIVITLMIMARLGGDVRVDVIGLGGHGRVLALVVRGRRRYYQYLRICEGVMSVEYS